MRAVVKKSKRKLTQRHLVVDWEGRGNLVYRMSKARVRNALINGIATMTEKLHDSAPSVTDYPVRRFPSGNIAIGCEHFTKAEVAELKRWTRKP